MTKFDFEAMMLQGLVHHYAQELAEAYSAQDGDRVQEIKAYIEGNYGRDALLHVAELAVLLVMNM